MNKKSLVSIIIPVYNREATLPRLFSSLKSIQYRPIEIIFVDNKSNDQSFILCKEFAKEQDVDFIIKTYTEQKQGACSCRNHGLKKSTGEYVYFFDSDDEISPEYITEMMNLVKQNTDMVCCPSCMFFPNGNSKKRDFYCSHRPSIQICTSFLATQGMFFRKSFLQKIGGWDERISRWNDWELGIRALIHSPNIQWTEKGYHKIHQHKNSISGSSFTHDYHSLKQCILIVEENLLKSQIPVRELNACKKALSGRAYILAANLYKEKENSNHQDAYILANRISQPLPFFHICAYLIYIYAKLGGRGAWKLFLTFIR